VLGEEGSFKPREAEKVNFSRILLYTIMGKGEKVMVQRTSGGFRVPGKLKSGQGESGK